MTSLFGLKKEIVEAGRRVHARGYVAANDGNISVRVGPDRILITPTGVSKGFMSTEQIVLCDMTGKSLTPGLKTSSEVRMHLKVYQHRPDVMGIVHAHPPYATSFGIAGIALSQAILPEVIITLGAVPIIEYGTPGTEELAEPLVPHLSQFDAFILQNHGALTLGSTLNDALFRMETVEHFAQIAFISSMLGRIQTLPETDVRKLLDQRQRYGFKSEFEPRVCSESEVSSLPDCAFVGTNQTVLRPRLPDIASTSQPENTASAPGSDTIHSVVARIVAQVLDSMTGSSH